MMKVRHSKTTQIEFIDPSELKTIDLKNIAQKAIYRGSPHHKSKPNDYGFIPQFQPRPRKNMCDKHKIIKKAEAEKLLQMGIAKGMISTLQTSGMPKYICAVDNDETIYIAKTDQRDYHYHGYPLRDKESRKLILKEWKKRSS